MPEVKIPAKVAEIVAHEVNSESPHGLFFPISPEDVYNIANGGFTESHPISQKVQSKLARFGIKIGPKINTK